MASEDLFQKYADVNPPLPNLARDLSGQKYGSLTAIKYVGSHRSKTRWLCRCDCGVHRVVAANSLRTGATASCGNPFEHKSRVNKNHLIDRMMAFVMPEPNSGCWIWMGAISRSTGYGRFTPRLVSRPVHRVMFEEVNGKIPSGLVVRHKCDVPCCVNPEHLEVGTHQDNANDKVARGRNAHLRGEGHTNSKLTAEDIITIRIRRERGDRRMDIAADYGVSSALIRLIVTRKKWKHIP